MYDTAIINGLIVDEDRIYKADVLIKDEKIAVIAEEGIHGADACTVIDGEGKYIFPGAVDLHAHFGNPGAVSGDPEDASAAAAVGGVTTCVDMPNNEPTSIINKEAFAQKRKNLEEVCHTDFCMWGALIKNNQKELAGLHEAGAVAFKSFLPGAGEEDFSAPDMWELRESLREIQKFGGVAGFHCEEFSIIDREYQKLIEHKGKARQEFLDSRPLIAEILAVRNVIELSRDTGAKVHICHCSHPRVVEIIDQARKEGVDISAETCTHYLAFTEKDFLEKGCYYKCAPPLRDENAREGLWELLGRGLFTNVASDHSAGTPENRQDETQPTYEAGSGISGIQTMMQVLFNEAVVKRGLSPSLLAKVTSSRPAERIGIYGKKGAVKVGFDADLVLVDPEKEWEIKGEGLLYRQKISGFVGLKGKGLPVMTLIRGHLVAQDGKIENEQFTGKLITRVRHGE